MKQQRCSIDPVADLRVGDVVVVSDTVDKGSFPDKHYEKCPPRYALVNAIDPDYLYARYLNGHGLEKKIWRNSSALHAPDDEQLNEIIEQL